MRCQINRKTLPLAEGDNVASCSCSSKPLAFLTAVVLQTIVATVVAAVMAATVAAVVAAVVAVTVAAAVAQNRYSCSLYLWIQEWTPVHSAKWHHQMVDTTAV